jgi:hypothetical protein
MTTTTTTTTATTIARPAELRAALKQAGFNARRISVRHDHSTLRATIRDASVSLTKVQQIAGAFESIWRCEATGEILLGGNCYVDVKYDDKVIEPLKTEITALLTAVPFDTYINVLGGFRALKESGVRKEVRLAGPGSTSATTSRAASSSPPSGSPSPTWMPRRTARFRDGRGVAAMPGGL